MDQPQTVTFSAARRLSRKRFPTQRGGFCKPGTGGAITGATDVVPVPSTGTVTEVGPLTSSPPSRGQSSGGALWTPAYTPGDSQTSRVYSNNPVLHLYISCYVTVNKPVLSYLSSRLLPQCLFLTPVNLAVKDIMFLYVRRLIRCQSYGKSRPLPPPPPQGTFLKQVC